MEIVCTDQDTARRLDACRRITRLTELRNLAEGDIDAGIRELAQARYRKLLCGLEEDGASSSERLAEIERTEDQRTLEHTAAQAPEPEIRRAAIARLTNPEALAACALQDAVTANRTAAAERLNDRSALECVSRQIGKRDKQVYRIVRHKLKEIAEREAMPERIRLQCEELCERVERLGRFDNWVQDRALSDLLDRQWSQIESGADEDQRNRYAAARERFLDAYAAYRREHEAQIAEEEAREANQAARAGLIEELAACASLSDEELLAARVQDIEARWAALGPLTEKRLQPMERELRAAGAAAAARLQALRSQRNAASRLGKLIAKAHKLLEQTKPVERKGIERLLEDGQALLAVEGLNQSLAAGFEEVRLKLEARLKKQLRHAEQRLEESQGKLTELEAALETGELKRAEPLFQSLQSAADLAESSALARKKVAALKDALRRLAPRLRELQKWRKFGADTHREGLCQAMEALETDGMPLEAKTLRLHDLQMEWKTVDRSGSPANQSLWERFNAASDRVYACCKPYLDEQAKERAAARAEREALCQQLETFLDRVDWERIDWKQAVRAEREMRRGWAAMGDVEGRHRRALGKRFRAGIERLDEKLAAERDRNQGFKRGLIERVEALAESPDLDSAIEETKRLQREWHTTVPARQRDENKLWQRFRAACDAIFARRRQQHEALSAELDDHLQAREAICAEAMALVRSGPQDPDALQAAFHKIEGRWHDAASLPVPNRAAGALQQRWREARSVVMQRQRELARDQRRKSLDLLARQAAVCQSLEHAVESGPMAADAVAAAESAWNGLPSHPDAGLQARIEGRFRAALDAAGSGAEALRSAMPENGARRAELCLHLEILAQVDSPPENRHERLALQVDRLKGHMRAGERDPLSDASRLLEDWYLCGPAPAAASSGLEQRFQRASRALEEDQQEMEPHQS
jgi:hypothetical protein